MKTTQPARLRMAMLMGCASLALVPAFGMAFASQASAASETRFSLRAQPLGDALTQLSRDSGHEIIYATDLVRGKKGQSVTSASSLEAALTGLLKGSGLTWRKAEGGAILIVKGSGEQVVKTATNRQALPKSQPKPQTDDSLIQEVVVTARRKEEKIIDVPVAVSAFTQQQLADLKIEGGAELLRAIPNVNFSKDNFTGYNFSIRGIGTKVLSSTADPAVAVAFNNTALLRNRLFEQEYFDVQRLEVLRGPQGTLYGRNATSGVVNMLPNLPELGKFSGEAQIEGGNFNSQRLRGMVNIPLGDKLAVRVAGAMTKRDGFDYNTVTQKDVNGRDLWSSRVGVKWEPTETFRANLLWEHFEEDDDRARTGKQLCTRGITPTKLDYRGGNGQTQQADVWTLWTRSALTPPCQAKSLYSDDAYGVADSFGSPYVTALLNVPPYKGDGDGQYLTNEYQDPFNTGDGTQSKNLREIATKYDPVFRAKNDVFQLNLDWDLTDALTLHSQTLYMEDEYYGSQDFMRSQPMSGAFRKSAGKTIRPWFDMRRNPNNYEYRFGLNGEDSAYGAIFCDPQLGCADHAQAVDISRSTSEQFSQEFRLQSAFDGNFNFTVGANYLDFKTREDYYIFSNLLTLSAMFSNMISGFSYDASDYVDCASNDTAAPNKGCAYIDPHPIDQIDGDGHNYYRAISISGTQSWALFGEAYVKLRDNLRLTAGLRYTNDEKTVTPVPSQLLTARGTANDLTSTKVSKGYFYEPDQVQTWGEFTGRLSLDWKPDLTFTDETMVYASYARGYKAGGGNPAGIAYDPTKNSFAPLPRAFAPEFINAFEVGTKNSFFGGKASFGATGFYYDYKDYQVTQLLDQGFHTENVDASIMGLEFESAWRPTKNLRIDATLGLLHTSIANGEKSIDVMNRTAGNDDWTVVRPWISSPFTCIVPTDIVAKYILKQDGPYNQAAIDAGGTLMRGSFYARQLCPTGNTSSPFTGSAWGFNWDPVNDARGGGRGFYTDLGGHELPNAPAFTFNIGAQYRTPLPGGWDVTWRGDYYRQSDSYARIYNTEYDKLEGWGNANLSATLTRAGSPVTAQLYVKNVFDDTPITDAFTGPDEMGNAANVFTLDPRIIGLSIRAKF